MCDTNKEPYQLNSRSPSFLLSTPMIDRPRLDLGQNSIRMTRTSTHHRTCGRVVVWNVYKHSIEPRTGINMDTGKGYFCGSERSERRR